MNDRGSSVILPHCRRESFFRRLLCFISWHRFVTHLRRLREPHVSVANLLASGVLELGDKLGPVLWQFPERLRFVACDFNAADFESSLVSGLVAEGFSVSGLTLFLWEGVITYLIGIGLGHVGG